MPLPSHGRYGYSALPERPVYDWPGGKRLAVYLGLNLETFAFGEGLGARLAPAAGDPDVLNFSWRDYGNRVGAWRLLELFETLGFPASVLANSALYDEAPELDRRLSDTRRRNRRTWPHQFRAARRLAGSRRARFDRGGYAAVARG